MSNVCKVDVPVVSKTVTVAAVTTPVSILGAPHPPVFPTEYIPVFSHISTLSFVF